MRIAKRNDAKAGEHGDARVGAVTLLHEFGNGSKDVVRVDTEFAGLLQIVGEDVEEEFGIGIGVDVSMSVVVEVVAEVRGVDEVAVLLSCISSTYGRQPFWPT